MQNPHPLGHFWQWVPPLAAFCLGLVIWLGGYNLDLFKQINSLYLISGETPWATLSILADALIAMVLLLPLIGRRPDILWAIILASLLTTLWVHGLKPILHNPRPAGIFSPDMIHIIGPILRNGSFPSGHTATAFMIAGVCGLLSRNRLILIGLLTLATLAGMSRIAVGAHWPLDVMAGAFGGWLAAVLGIRLARHWPVGEGILGQRIIAAILVTGAIALLTIHDTHFTQGWWLQRIIAVSCLVLAIPGLRKLWR